MCNLLNKDSEFIFDEAYLLAFNTLKEKLISTPIIVTPNWSQLFEIMCDAKEYAMRAVLRQCREKLFGNLLCM